jgi:hypothetical protein
VGLVRTAGARCPTAQARSRHRRASANDGRAYPIAIDSLIGTESALVFHATRIHIPSGRKSTR